MKKNYLKHFHLKTNSKKIEKYDKIKLIKSGEL